MRREAPLLPQAVRPSTLSAPALVGARELVAPERSALARTLRQSGWVVRGGWRSSAARHGCGEAPWMLRLAAPAEAGRDPSGDAVVEGR
jgi:hypothetical protein